MKNIRTVEASEVPTEVALVGLDNGYVVENVEAEDAVSLSDGSYHFSVGEGRRLITFHDANGDENYLILHDSHPLDIGDF